MAASADSAGGASPAPVIAAGTARSSSLSERLWPGPAGMGAESCHLTAAVPALAHCWPSSRCIAAEDAEDRNSGADADAQARIAAAAITASSTAGWPNGSSGARRHGGSSSTPPAVRGRVGAPAPAAGGRVRVPGPAAGGTEPAVLGDSVTDTGSP